MLEFPAFWPFSNSRICVFFGSARTFGSASAAFILERRLELSNAALIVVGIRVNSTENSTATPSVPPIWRKKVDAEVATPMSLGPTAFWLAIVRVCMSWPSPSPTKNMPSMTYQTGVEAWMKVNRKNPSDMRPVPMIGKIL